VERLRAIGVRVIPRGPRLRTRLNPAGLTSRELEVLALLGQDLRNVDIAERLVVSAKTVDHHVSAILRKLGVHNRAAAADEAVRLGLKDGEIASPNRERLPMFGAGHGRKVESDGRTIPDPRPRTTG
jgi:DNA-binding CsgD family transcriptional regulator